MKGLTLVLVGAMLSIAIVPFPAAADGSCGSPFRNMPDGPIPAYETLYPGESDWWLAPHSGTAWVVYRPGSHVDMNTWSPDCEVKICDYGGDLYSLKCHVEAGGRVEVSYGSSLTGSTDYVIRYA